MLIGAGHATHFPLLALQKKYGGKTVVVMKPSLPTSLFDLCLVPAHDNLRFQAENIIRTEGPPNRVQPSSRQEADKGLILIGGPSKHFHWSDESVLQQVRGAVAGSFVNWIVVTSERTPDSFVRKWRNASLGIPLVTPKACSSQWLPEQLSECSAVWVTCDSMSMIYEALTAGASVGLFELPASARGRISLNVQRISEMGLVTTYNRWQRERELPFPKPSFSESDRCSAIIYDRCLSRRSAGATRSVAAPFLAGRIIAQALGMMVREHGAALSGDRFQIRPSLEISMRSSCEPH
jgi:mitochondrial fission protein ELM1